MRISEYQIEAAKTAVYPPKVALPYLSLGLAAEAGEVADVVKRMYRDGRHHLSREEKMRLADELGDVLWYVARLSTMTGLSMWDITQQNLEKLRNRQSTGTLKGRIK